MKKACVQTTYPFLKERNFQSQQKTKMKATLLVVLLLFLPALWKGDNLNKVTLGNSYWTRESQYDIGVGSTNETYRVFIIRKALLVSGPTPRL